MTKFRYLSLKEFDALDVGQKAVYINAALDHLIARDALVPLRVDRLGSPQLNGAKRSRPHDGPEPIGQPRPAPPATLGDVLYAKSGPGISERDWAGLVESVAASDQLALHALYDRAHSLVFTLAMRITGNRETAEELTVDVFYAVWRRVSRYDANKATVLGWIMNQARSGAIDRVRFEQRKTLEAPTLDSSAASPQDVLRPAPALQSRLARRIAQDAGTTPMLHAAGSWSEPEWQDVAPGISCKLFATDEHRHRVSMAVRLAPGTAYPPHRHAGVEELHLLHGELWIDERKLYPGDYNRAEPGTSDQRVWSETGCTCVLMTSTQDLLS